MAAIKYIVKSVEKKRLASIYLRFVSSNDINIWVSIPLKVYPEYWSNKKEGFINKIAYDDLFTEAEKIGIEKELNDLRSFILSQYNESAKTGFTLNREWLKSVIDKYFNKQVVVKENLNQYITRFIKEIESGERLYTHNDKTKRYEKGSIKNFKGFQVQFDLYQSEKRVKLNFDSITLDFYDLFVKHFIKKDYSANTIGKHVARLKTIMRCSKDEGLHTSQEFERKKFKTMKEKVENIYLTEKEVGLMQSFDFSKLTPEQIVIMQENGITNINHLDIARDVFLVGVYTAQRFSDFSKIKPENIQNRQGGLKIISLIQQKTGERVIIPIRPELDVILNKYGYRLPKVFEQKINKAIKVIGSILDINEPTLIEETKGGFKVKKTVPKYDLIKTHTARRTGCTLMYLAGVPTIDIMKISGHKTEREFLNYIKVGKEETAINLSKHPYFLGNNLKLVM